VSGTSPAVRGQSLLVGLELASSPGTGAVVNGLHHDGALIGRTGRRKNVLKIRPPLILGHDHAKTLVEAICAKATASGVRCAI
jgi:4-aminobutyrate aminotransferase-like enzyme